MFCKSAFLRQSPIKPHIPEHYSGEVEKCGSQTIGQTRLGCNQALKSPPGWYGCQLHSWLSAGERWRFDLCEVQGLSLWLNLSSWAAPQLCHQYPRSHCLHQLHRGTHAVGWSSASSIQEAVETLNNKVNRTASRSQRQEHSCLYHSEKEKIRTTRTLHRASHLTEQS